MIRQMAFYCDRSCANLIPKRSTSPSYSQQSALSEWRKVKLGALEFFTVSPHCLPSLAIIKMSCSSDVICWQHKRQKKNFVPLWTNPMYIEKPLMTMPAFKRNYNAKQVHLNFWPQELEPVLQATDTGTQNCCLLHKPYWKRGTFRHNYMR